jgi:hypothetical protein
MSMGHCYRLVPVKTESGESRSSSAPVPRFKYGEGVSTASSPHLGKGSREGEDCLWDRLAFRGIAGHP